MPAPGRGSLVKGLSQRGSIDSTRATYRVSSAPYKATPGVELKRSQVRLALENMSLVMEHLEKRFGSNATVGELRSVMVGQLALYERRRITVSELADQSGQPLSSVSRWLIKIPWIRMVRHPEDARAKYLEVDDVERLTAWVTPLAHRYKDYGRDQPGDQLPLCNCTVSVEDRSGACNVR